jgi:hypothetical protein
MKRSYTSTKRATAKRPKPGVTVDSLPNVGQKTLHWVDVSLAETSNDSFNHTTVKTLDITAASSVDLGSAYDKREGPRIRVKKLLVNLAVNTAYGSDQTIESVYPFKVFVVVDKCNNNGDTTTSPSTVFDHGQGYCFIKMSNRKRFKILHESTHSLRIDVAGNANGGGGESRYHGATKFIEMCLDVDIPIDYSLDSASGAKSDVEHNNIYLYVVPLGDTDGLKTHAYYYTFGTCRQFFTT